MLGAVAVLISAAMNYLYLYVKKIFFLLRIISQKDFFGAQLINTNTATATPSINSHAYVAFAAD